MIHISFRNTGLGTLQLLFSSFTPFICAFCQYLRYALLVLEFDYMVDDKSNLSSEYAIASSRLAYLSTKNERQLAWSHPAPWKVTNSQVMFNLSIKTTSWLAESFSSKSWQERMSMSNYPFKYSCSFCPIFAVFLQHLGPSVDFQNWPQPQERDHCRSRSSRR